MNTYLCIYLGAAFIAIMVTPMAIRFARAASLMDSPGVRRIHTTPVPRLGGLAVAAAMLPMICCVLFMDNTIGQAFRRNGTQFTVLLVGAVFMLAVGLIDDVRGMRARTKLLSQLAAAAAACACGIRIDAVRLEGLFVIEFGWWAWPITIFWITGIINAVNLIDGLDGLAAGIMAVVCGVIAVFAVYTGQPVMAILMLGALGSLTGFLFYNFNPAKIFMGDGGTHFMGYIIGVGSVMCAAKSSTIVGLALPALAMGVPIFDTLFSIMRRLLERRSISAPDRAHIHHRLLNLGLHQRQAVMLMYAVTLLAAALGLFMMITRKEETIIVFGGIIVLLILMFRAIGSVRFREAFASIRRNQIISRQAKKERRDFEESQLFFRQAESFDDWWQAVCAAAEGLELIRVAIIVHDRNGESRTLLWKHPSLEPQPHGTISMAIPIRDRRSGLSLQADVEVHVNGSLEGAGRRVSLFTRLMEEHGLATLAAPGRYESEVADRGDQSTLDGLPEVS